MLKKFSLFALGLLLFAAGCKQAANVDNFDTRTALDGTQWSVDVKSGEIEPILDQEKTFGAGFSPVTGYQTQTTVRVSASATTIPVASVTDKAGNTINPSLISSSSTVRMYFNFEPGTPREEPFYCTGISSLNLTGCVRGLAFQGSDLTASSTIAQIHNAGSPIIMTNLGIMYGNEFVGTSGAQTIFDLKTFNTFPRTSSTTALPSANNELATKLYVDNVGAGGFTSSNVSSTLGLQAITSGVPNCPTGAACVGVNASSTGSANGGFLNFATGTGVGKLYWDIQTFLTGAARRFTTLVADTFTGTSTVDTLQITGIADTANDAINKSSLNTSVSYNSATGTAGITIAVGNTLYISTTGTLFLADADATSTAYTFVGIATAAASAGSEVTYAKPGGIIDNLTGLSSGKTYFLSGTAGSVQTTPGTIPVRIGVALSANRLQIMSPSYRSRASGVASLFDGSSGAISTGFIPTRVQFLCEGASQHVSEGVWTTNSDGTTSTRSWGTDDDAIPYTKFSTIYTCQWEEGSTDFWAFITTSTGGFTINTPNAATRSLFWTAEYDPDIQGK